MVWYGKVWYSEIIIYNSIQVWHQPENGMVCYGMVRYDIAWYGMVWYDMILHGMVRYAMVWYGMQ